MAKEMNMRCNFLKNNLTCVLPEHMMGCTSEGEDQVRRTYIQEDVYTRTLKYRSGIIGATIPLLKKRVANMFRKRNSLSDSSRGTSTQTIVNNIEQCKVETRNKDSEMDSDRDSMHSNWSELIPITNEMNKSKDVVKANTQPRKRAIKNIVLVPYKPKQNTGEAGR